MCSELPRCNLSLGWLKFGAIVHTWSTTLVQHLSKIELKIALRHLLQMTDIYTFLLLISSTNMQQRVVSNLLVLTFCSVKRLLYCSRKQPEVLSFY